MLEDMRVMQIFWGAVIGDVTRTSESALWLIIYTIYVNSISVNLYIHRKSFYKVFFFLMWHIRFQMCSLSHFIILAARFTLFLHKMVTSWVIGLAFPL